jgi:hypothetical protein
MNIGRVALPVLFLFLGSCILSFGQNAGQLPGEFLIQLEKGADLNTLSALFSLKRAERAFSVEPISETMRIWHLKVNHNSGIDLNWLRSVPGIAVVQSNHILENRMEPPNNMVPDDPLFPQQWQYYNTGNEGGAIGADLAATDAWNITTGGITPAGDSIVVAIIDGGFSKIHSDINSNVWINRAEIPADDIDNDGNGFVDDYQGWNVSAQNDAVLGNGGAHGTPIMGIIGAKGNNTVGVTGINWQVKMMRVVGNNTEAEVLLAYDYVLKNRRLYNKTHGTAGALIVSVNCSWGIDYGQPSEAPIWCSVFDTLGAAGILSIAATANLPVNVDVVGDLPTTCPSNYLVSVTSLNRKDQKAPNAAWGAQHIDLGAYGHGIYSTTIDGYGYFEGTSFAAPEVSGAIGLLYSSPCTELAALALGNPEAAAKYARSLLMESVLPNATLKGITRTGGRLELNSLLQFYEQKCSACQAPFALKADQTLDAAVQLSWLSTLDDAQYEIELRKKGSDSWQISKLTSKLYKLTDLEKCTDYEYGVRMQCAENEWSKWSETFTFTSAECCKPPTFSLPVFASSDAIEFQWHGSDQSTGFELRFRPETDTSWQSVELKETNFTFEGFEPCTRYLFQVRTFCGKNEGKFSENLYVTTPGCGACLDKQYCSSMAKSAQPQWIASVKIGDWQNAPGITGGAGYQDFTNSGQQLPPILQAGTQYPIIITPGFAGMPTKSFYRVYIDLDQDGSFQESEIVYDPGFAHSLPANGWINLPFSLDPGMSRMRVMMKSANDMNYAPGACESFDFGQVEDYCVQLKPSITQVQNDQTTTFKFYLAPQPAHSYTTLYANAPVDSNAEVVVFDLLGRVMQRIETAQFPLTLSLAAFPAGNYAVQVRTATESRSLVLVKYN